MRPSVPFVWYKINDGKKMSLTKVITYASRVIEYLYYYVTSPACTEAYISIITCFNTCRKALVLMELLKYRDHFCILFTISYINSGIFHHAHFISSCMTRVHTGSSMYTYLPPFDYSLFLSHSTKERVMYLCRKLYIVAVNNNSLKPWHQVFGFYLSYWAVERDMDSLRNYRLTVTSPYTYTFPVPNSLSLEYD